MDDDKQVAAVARALGHPTRVWIVRLLSAQTECRGVDVFGELPLAQSTISEHLRILKDAGIVTSRPEGTGMVYCLAPNALDGLVSAVTEITNVHCVAERKGC